MSAATMSASARTRLSLLLVAAAAAAAVLAGCGGSGGGASSDPASLAPASSPLYLEVTLRPQGEEKANVEALAKQIAGVGNLGRFVVSKLKAAGGGGGKLDFAREVEPWLGKKAGLSFERYSGGDLHGFGLAIQTTDADASREFVTKQAARGSQPSHSASYEGVDYEVRQDGTCAGVIGEFVSLAENPAMFKSMVIASKGESLAAQKRFSSALAAAPSGGFATVYLDLGRLLEARDGGIEPDLKTLLGTLGASPAEATAVATLVPGSGHIEVDLSSNLSRGQPSAADPSAMLASLPAGAFAALAYADFGTGLGRALDRLDARGIPGQVPPHRLKGALAAAGVDLDRISASLGDLGLFATGGGRQGLSGAAVLEDRSASEARNAVTDVGLLLRATGTAGVAALPGGLSGFSVRSEKLGPKPLVVAAAGERIAIAYGLPAARLALASGGTTLGESPLFKEAAAALGDTPISGFATGTGVLELANALASHGGRDLKDAKPYLGKISYLALGPEAFGGRPGYKLIVGVGG